MLQGRMADPIAYFALQSSLMQAASGAFQPHRAVYIRELLCNALQCAKHLSRCSTKMAVRAMLCGL